jgi:RNA polymerase sigma-70 factor (ECF subfamily)
MAADYGVMEQNDFADALLREAAWVRRLSGRLVRDGSAEDVAQDAWLQALKQRPSTATSLRGWLAEVMRRLAHTRTRADARRQTRERDEIVEGEVPPADRLLEKAELLRRIVVLVGELEEPYRSTLLLRYFENQSAAEIARQAGIPAGTVRWRIKEALDQLRARLSNDVDDARIRRAFAPIAGAGFMAPVLKLGFAAAAAAMIVGGAVVIGSARPHHAVVVAEPPPRKSEVLTADALADAQAAYIRGDYHQAITLARPQAASHPQKAWRIIGASSCFLKDAAGATAAHNELDDQGRKFVTYVCSRNGITLPQASQLQRQPVRPSGPPRG